MTCSEMESVDLVRELRSRIYKCFPNTEERNNCTILIFVDEHCKEIKVGNGNFEMVINKVGKKLHVISPNFNIEFECPYMDILNGFFEFDLQDKVRKWWNSRTVDEVVISRGLAM